MTISERSLYDAQIGRCTQFVPSDEVEAVGEMRERIGERNDAEAPSATAMAKTLASKPASGTRRAGPGSPVSEPGEREDQYGFTSAASTSTLTAWLIISTDNTSRACTPFRRRRPTTPVSEPCATSTIRPCLISGQGSKAGTHQRGFRRRRGRRWKGTGYDVLTETRSFLVALVVNSTGARFQE